MDPPGLSWPPSLLVFFYGEAVPRHSDPYPIHREQGVLRGPDFNIFRLCIQRARVLQGAILRASENRSRRQISHQIIGECDLSEEDCFTVQVHTKTIIRAIDSITLKQCRECHHTKIGTRDTEPC